MSERDPQFQYLGDGVYASFDGRHIWLHLGSHLAPPLVALESEVLEALFHYALRVMAEKAPGPPNVSPEPDASPRGVREASKASSETESKLFNCCICGIPLGAGEATIPFAGIPEPGGPFCAGCFRAKRELFERENDEPL